MHIIIGFEKGGKKKVQIAIVLHVQYPALGSFLQKMSGSGLHINHVYGGFQKGGSTEPPEPPWVLMGLNETCFLVKYTPN